MHQHGMNRLKLFCATAMSGLTCFQFLFNPNTMMEGTRTPPEVPAYHEPPPGVDYSTNPSVFGKILNGQLPSRTLKESTNLLAFEDRSPKANLHGLVIPKQFLESIFSLQLKDVQLVQEMRQMGLDLIEEQYPEAYASDDYMLCFHIPPFNSIDHLHLHVLAPASSMSFANRYIKYQCPTRWCTSIAQVLERLQLGQPAVPYKKPPKIFPTR
jgi:diadenosine tetraphosphate (Ap4A) HIT family hydrolase